MRIILFIGIILLLASCTLEQHQNLVANKKIDHRPASQVSFMKKLGGISRRYYGVNGNSIVIDKMADSLTNYGLDSLKEVKNWELVVIDITDYDMSNTGRLLFDGMPVYTINMASIVDMEEQRRDRSDTLIIGNYVGLKYTLPKKPKGEMLKRHLEVVGSLSPGDTVLVSGGVTMLNDTFKVDFSEALKGAIFLADAFDFLVTDIKKK